MVLVIFVLIVSVFTVSAESVSALADKVKALEEKYGFEVVISQVLLHTRGRLWEEKPCRRITKWQMCAIEKF